MIDYILEPLFHVSGIKKNWEIEITDGLNTYTFTNTDIVSEGITIVEKLININQSDSIIFGEFKANEFRATIGYVDDSNYKPLTGMTMNVRMWLENYSGNKLQIGTYKVVSDKITSDHKRREISGYDILSTFNDGDLSEWYEEEFGNGTTIMLHTLFNDFMDKMGIVCETSLSDKVNVLVHKYDLSTLRPSDLLINICELWAVFPTIGRNGNMQLISLGESTSADGTFPSITLYPGNTTYPYRGSGSFVDIGVNNYIPPCQSENYTVEPITRVMIRDKDGYVVHYDGTQGNDYYIDNNFLTFGMTQAQLETVGSAFIARASQVTYRPFSVKTIGNPCYECGDSIKIATPYGDVEGFIFERTIKGGQKLTDEFTAKGNKDRKEKVSTYSPISGGGGGSTTASDVSYSNTTSGLAANNVQSAIDELSGGFHKYSTTERIVGKWIDNKPVYEQIFHVNSMSIGSSYIDIDKDIDTVVELIGNGYSTQFNQWTPIPNGHSENTAYLTAITFLYNNGLPRIRVDIANGWTNGLQNINVTFRYTKTTD